MVNGLRRTSVASDRRKLVWGECGFSPEPMDDPVLSSFSRCLAVDILCVWRRVAAAQPPGSGGGGGLFDSFGLPPAASSQPAAQQHPPLSLHAAKELWIFWYGEEPDLSGLVAPELISSVWDNLLISGESEDKRLSDASIGMFTNTWGNRSSSYLERNLLSLSLL
uniref:Mediator of RNA polymerase II transcription subunit 13 n=1 Tax=Timema shepardi TaxID=629360 RepID=A0A7R9ARH2_TIMSH|nr:unnamed protein product [Timema shepardi]